MTRLLNRPLRAFALYALLILLVSIPAYVLVLDYIWLGELDEHNWTALQQAKQQLQAKAFTPDEIEKINETWNSFKSGMSIHKMENRQAFQDSIYNVRRLDVLDPERDNDRFRGILSYIEINGEPYQLTVETNVEDSDDTFMAVALVTLLFFVILILGFIFLNRKIAAKAWKPFYRTLHALQSFELSSNQSLQLPTTDIQEFQELNNSLEQLVSKNRAAYQLQKSFTENASHELQTPIALLKSKLDLLLQEKELSPELSDILESIEIPLLRLSRINKNLLMLAKVENQQYSEQEALDVQEYIESALTLFEDYLADKNLSLSTHFQNSRLVEANPFLLETLMQNLLSNAIRHTPSGGQIVIRLENNSLCLSNSGQNPLDEQHLFERFYTSSKNKVSSGLGLAIIREIANRYGWRVKYGFEKKFHVFSVEF